MAKRIFYLVSIFGLIISFLLYQMNQSLLFLFIFAIAYTILGLFDLRSNHNVLRNYPVIGHFRYMLEAIRPEIQQYFIASNHSGRPFNREQRSIVYQRSKNVIDTLPFGTQQDIDKPDYEFALHSLHPITVNKDVARVMVGNEQCKKPYFASRLNVSAMSFGALGHTAIEALNWGAKMGDFAHNTGEGGLSPYHLKHGGDIILQIGTAYFGFRNADGTFCPDKFKEKAHLDVVKMIEIKLSQGAKPSHGGLLPGDKVDKEIATIRGIEMGKDCLSPPTHSSFSTPLELMKFITQLRELSGGKPIGFKLCIGQKQQFLAICKAMLETKVYPDFITVDGAEGGTGAAPIEFSNRLGTPINEAISFVSNSLIGVGLRDKVKLIASGKLISGFDLVNKLALGADMCNSARAMMFSIGCIQSLRCNTNECPTGVATQDPKRTRAVVPEEKRFHVYNFHRNTIESFLDLLGAMGVAHPEELTPYHIRRRIEDGHSKPYATIYPQLDEGVLLSRKIPHEFKVYWDMADSQSF